MFHDVPLTLKCHLGKKKGDLGKMCLLSEKSEKRWGKYIFFSDSRQSITGNIFRYDGAGPGAPIPRKSKLQKSGALPNSEAEYYSASLGEAEVIYLRQLLRDIGFEPKSPTPVCIEWTNNVSGG